MTMETPAPHSPTSGWHRHRTKAIETYLAHEHTIALFGFVLGFTVDAFLFSSIDHIWKTALIGIYVGIAAITILWYQVAKMKEGGSADFFVRAAPFVMQFSFGGVMSACFVTFFLSAALVQSWIFFLAISVLLYFNEYGRAGYHEIQRQTAMLFASIFIFSIFLMPMIFHTVNATVFLASSLSAMLAIILFLLVLYALNRATVRAALLRIAWVSAAIITLANILFFARLIPPIPLILVDAGVYHGITRDVNGVYHILTDEDPTIRTNPLVHTFARTPGSAVYFYSAIFAPPGMRVPLVHEWQQKNDAGAWVTAFRIEFAVTGGRNEGFRAYSTSHATPGAWRVRVLTHDGSVLGVYRFTVLERLTAPTLREITR